MPVFLLPVVFDFAMVGQDGVVDSFTPPAGGTLTAGARPNGGDDAGAHSGKPAKGGALSAVRVQCGRSATIWASSRTGDPYFVILGGIIVAPNVGFDASSTLGIFGFSPTFTHFRPFAHFFAHPHHGLPHFGVGP